LSINGTELINHDGPHGPTEIFNSIFLSVGFHALNVGYFEIGGGESLVVSYSSSQIVKQAIPAEVLFKANPFDITTIHEYSRRLGSRYKGQSISSLISGTKTLTDFKLTGDWKLTIEPSRVPSQ